MNSILKDYKRHGSKFPQFLLVAGNERNDECLFEKANQLGDDKVVAEAITVNVTSRQTAAR